MVRHWSRKRGGLVLSGGEPFLQAEGLAELCQGVRALAPATPILVYTGYLLEELLGGNRPGWRSLLQSADVLIDGPYVADNPSGCALAGSGNQRVFVFGDRIDSSKLASLPSFLVQARIERRGMVRLVGTGAINMHGLVRRIESTGFRLEE
jgi:anaerobic ribonucleoside-triphosphate reductase activating protein